MRVSIVPKVTTYMTSYKYIEVTSMPNLLAARLDVDLSAWLIFASLAILLYLLIICSLSKVGSIIVQLKREARDSLKAQNELFKTENESLLIKQSSLLQNLNQTKTAGERKAFGVQQWVHYLEVEITSLKDELASRPRPEIIIKSTDKTLLRSVMAKKWREDPNGPVAQGKLVVKELKDAQFLLSEVSTQLTKPRENADALHSEVEALRAIRSTADEEIERLNKRCNELTKHRDHWYKRYRKCTGLMKAEQLKTKDLTKQVDRCNDKIEPLKAEFMSLQISYTEALNTIKILEVDISQRKTPAEWDQMVCKWMMAEKLVTRESDRHSTLRIDYEHLKWKFECLEAEVRISNGRSNRSKGDILKALYHSDKPAPNSKVDSVELDYEKKRRNNAEKLRDNALRELEILQHRFNEYARIQVASETDKLNTALTAREDQCAELLQQMVEANQDILRQKEDLRNACQLIQNYKQELEKRDRDDKIHTNEKEVMEESFREELKIRSKELENQIRENEERCSHELAKKDEELKIRIREKEERCTQELKKKEEDYKIRIGEKEALLNAENAKDKHSKRTERDLKIYKTLEAKAREEVAEISEELRRLKLLISTTFGAIPQVPDITQGHYAGTLATPVPGPTIVNGLEKSIARQQLEQLCYLAVKSLALRHNFERLFNASKELADVINRTVDGTNDDERFVSAEVFLEEFKKTLKQWSEIADEDFQETRDLWSEIADNISDNWE